MITIGDRLKEAIDYMGQGQIEHALTPTCIAIDLTAQKIAGKEKSAKSDYKKFVSDYMWLISYMGLPNIMANAIRISFKHPNVKSDSEGYCRIEDIVYHAIRCGLIHSTGTKIQWCNDGTILGSDESGNLKISDKFIWGLIGAVVFCPKNKDESISEIYWISIDGFKFFIQEVWGRIDLAIRVINMNRKSKNN